MKLSNDIEVFYLELKKYGKWLVKMCGNQGRNEVRLRPGQEARLAPPRSNLRSFGSKCTPLKKVLAILLGLSDAPCSDSAPR